MTMRTFCNKCGRDITNHNRFSISFRSEKNDDVMTTRFFNCDLCMSCAQGGALTLVNSKLISAVVMEVRHHKND
jgi:hypothetical protein